MSGGLFALDRLIDRYWPEGRDWLNKHVSSASRKRAEIAVLIFGIFLAGFLAWKGEHEKLIAKTPLDPAAVYQDGFPAASIRNIDISAAENIISFDVITAQKRLDFTRGFEFREWKLACSGKEANSMTFGAMLQINYINVVCRIQGAR